MSIADGFYFWIGKQLADAAIPLALVAILFGAYVILRVLAKIESALRRKKRP
ncbi:hypothetical protein [Phenylobacterium kunshanense]|uniref:hypothetical protein n=1 Tax=Phenylobacterium kunshanense TaxID=1445034 RepID=UPI001403A029|nr:hypothetical protein [Phenylobacterium kunshanense]